MPPIQVFWKGIGANYGEKVIEIQVAHSTLPIFAESTSQSGLSRGNFENPAPVSPDLAGRTRSRVSATFAPLFRRVLRLCLKLATFSSTTPSIFRKDFERLRCTRRLVFP